MSTPQLTGTVGVSSDTISLIAPNETPSTGSSLPPSGSLLSSSGSLLLSGGFLLSSCGSAQLSSGGSLLSSRYHVMAPCYYLVASRFHLPIWLPDPNSLSKLVFLLLHKLFLYLRPTRALLLGPLPCFLCVLGIRGTSSDMQGE